MNENRAILNAALFAETVAEAKAVQALIADSVGQRFIRPLGDRFQNLGILGSGGSFDLTLIEQVTNMQDAVLERRALAEWGTRENVPYTTPFQAAEDLLADLSDDEKCELVSVRFVESDGAPSRSKRLTAVFRDTGIGMTPAGICNSLFRLGGSNKEDALYLQGAFGLGGALTYRNAESIVVVSRRDPEMLADGEEDEISVAVVEWRQGTKGQTAVYLVDREWSEAGDYARTWACQASDFPEFEVGTQISLVSYRVEGIYRGFESDEKSFPSILNTRLFRPVMPILFSNETDRGRNTKVRGLERKLEISPLKFPSDTETLIFKYGGETYHLPITYTLFPASGPGNRRSIVAHDHAVLFLSNGQVHHHWTLDEFKNKTHHNQLKKRILIVVETDDLPITLRTALFTPDRASLVKADIALRLEQEVRAFIDGWDALKDENRALIRAALNDSLGESSAAIGQRIGRAISATGFASSGGDGTSGSGSAGSGGRSGGGGGTTKPIELLSDPTYLAGPVAMIAEKGRTLSRTFVLNAPDGFLETRGNLQVYLDHPDIDLDRDISVGPLRAGRFRLQIALPETMEPDNYVLSLKIEDWFKTSGGLGSRLDFVTEISVVDELSGKGSGSGAKPGPGGGDDGPSGGTSVALRWMGIDNENFSRASVGMVEGTPANLLAESDPINYSDLAVLGEALIPTITLNYDYSPLKKYLGARSQKLETLERPRETYAIGVGVALLLLEQHNKAQQELGKDVPSDDFLASAQQAAARAVLAVMPSFDELARESGLSD